MDPELFESSFFELYQNFGSTCLFCLRLHTDISLSPGVKDCARCGKNVEAQMNHWQEWNRHFLIWDTGDSEEICDHRALVFGSVTSFLQLVPLEFLVLFLDEVGFQCYNQIASFSEGVPRFDLSELRSNAVQSTQAWCANIVKEEDKKDDFSEHYFIAKKLLKSLPRTLDQDFFRRVEFHLFKLPFYHWLEELSEALLAQVNNNCVVCSKQFSPKKQVFVFPRCKHLFHSQCAEAWFRTSVTCPLCREPLRK